MDFIRRYKIDIIIFTLALVARLALFGINLHAAHGDLIATIHGDDGYYEISKDLVAGHGFSGELKPPFAPNPLRTPLYPYFIAAILALTGSYWVAIVIQMIIGAFIPVLGRRIALEIIGTDKVGMIVGVILTFEPYLLLFSSIFYTETLFIFLFLVFALAFTAYLKNGSMRALVWSALILGLATLTKTTPQFLPILLAPLFYFNFRHTLPARRIFLNIFVFAVVFIATLSPWLYRNYREFGVPGMSAQPAYNVYVYLVPSVLATVRGTSFSAELAGWATLEEASTPKITLANGPFYVKKAWSVIREYPRALVTLTGVSFVTFFTHDGVLTILQHAGITPGAYIGKPALSLIFADPVAFFVTIKNFAASPMISVLLFRLFWIVVTIAFFLGSIVFVRRRGWEVGTVFAFILILYFLVTTPINGLGVNARFRMPVNAVILSFAAYFFCRNCKNKEKNERQKIL